ncbi:ARM repeat-containing protein [Nemania sp. FL0916]|nr:ARM repeat-containing protein [Nemania sp. FL0916]
MSDPNSRNTQNIDPYRSTAWRSNGIWGNIGGSKTANHDSAGSKESDELSPTAPSGSAQLNGLSESGPWPSRAVWGPANKNPNDASSPLKKDTFSYNSQGASGNSNMYNLRQSMSQGPPLHGLLLPAGSTENSASSTRYNAAVGGISAEDRAGTGIYGTFNAHQLSSNTPGSDRRNSADPSFLGAGHSRAGTLSGRRPEINNSALNGQYGEPRQYSFSKGVHVKPPSQRPSVSNASVPMASETSRGQNMSFQNETTQASLSESLNRNLTLESTVEPLNGYPGNGYNNPASSQPFEFNPGSQPWQNEMGNGIGNLGYAAQRDTWTEPSGPYPGVKRGSIERSSPASSSYRPQLSSPRNISVTPNSRTDISTRQVPRNPNMAQDLDRQQYNSQYPVPSPGFYQPYFPSHLSQFSTPYEQFTQLPNYPRGHIATAGYGGQMNCIGVSMRSNRDKDPSQGARSDLLEEFRSLNRSNRRYELKDLYGHIVEFSGDQHGSRFIQDKLTAANSEEKEHVFREIESNAVQLMKDVFGNYVIQKFFEHGNQVQKKLLAAQMKGKVCDLSVQMYSCRVVQKALEHVLVEQQREIVEELKAEIVHVAKDQNGNHVVQKVIGMFPELCIPFIMEAFHGQIESLASHGYACRVIQRILEHGTGDEKKRLMSDIHVFTTKLMTDQYGNYVIQHVISHGEQEDRSIMIRQVIDRALVLSRHKYASNIVEKCIEFGTVDERRIIRAKLTAQASDGNSPLQLLVKDQFGNYVIQKLLDFLEGEEKWTFAQEIKAIVPLLRRQGNGRQNTALERLIAACDTIPPPSTATGSNNGSAATTGTAPSTPNLAVEVSSAVPTPLLTTEQNSPQSTSPPSTSISTADEAADETKTAQVPPPAEAPSSPVCV